jgi:hypothetical protein
MQQNGDTLDFSWVQSRILQSLEAQGMNPDHLEALRQKVRGINELLESFRAKRKEMGDSGRYSAKGLEEAAAELAANVAGEIKRLMDDTHLRNNLAQKRAKLQASPPGDTTQRLLDAINGLREDLRVQSTQYSIQALGIAPNDSVQFHLLYQEALERNDIITQRALEEWPIRSPISDALRQQGQRQREMARDPLLSREIQDLETLHEQFTRITKDALQELPLPSRDPLEAMARGESDAREGQ